MSSKRSLFDTLEAAQKTEADFPSFCRKLLDRHRLSTPQVPDPDESGLLRQVLAGAPALLWLREGERWQPSDAECQVVNSRSGGIQKTLFFDRKRLAVATLLQHKQELDRAIGGTTRRFPTLEKAEAAWKAMLVKHKIVPAPEKVPSARLETAPNEAALMKALAANPDDVDVLRVLADHWVERGDLRGEFVQLCLLENPTPAQVRRMQSLKTTSKGKLVGLARPYLYLWEFGANGLVRKAFVQPEKVIEGLDALASLNPRLVLDIAAFKNAKTTQAFAALSLAAFETVKFGALTDTQLQTIAPSLKGVRRLAFQCSGYADTYFTPVGLIALAQQVEKLEALSINYYRARAVPNETRPLLPEAQAYVDVIVSHPGFSRLKSIEFSGVPPTAFRSLAHLEPAIEAS